MILVDFNGFRRISVDFAGFRWIFVDFGPGSNGEQREATGSNGRQQLLGRPADQQFLSKG